MAFVEARLKVKGKEFCISVDVDEALKVKKGAGDVTRALNSNAIYEDLRKGLKSSEAELDNCFGTTDVYEIATRIMKEGEIQKPQEYRDAEREERKRKVIGLLLRNAVDQHGKPFTEERLKRAVEDVHFNFENKPTEKLMHDLVHKLRENIPIKIETKKIKLTIPARFTGQVYGVVNDYKEKEEWQNNGDLVVIVNIPAGMQVDFYEKLNGVTHGAVQSEEINE